MRGQKRAVFSGKIFESHEKEKLKTSDKPPQILRTSWGGQKEQGRSCLKNGGGFSFERNQKVWSKGRKKMG